MSKQINSLSGADRYKLIKLVESSYVERRETDKQFADWASEQLQIPLTAANIMGAREVIDMPSTRMAAIAGKENSDTRRIEKLEAQVAQLVAAMKAAGFKVVTME